MTDRGRYRVSEQQRIGDILEQQELQALSGIVDAGTAQEIRNLIGVRALVMASIDRLRYDEDRTTAGIAWIDSQNVELEMSARIVLVETGEFVASADVDVSRGRGHWVAFGFLKTGGLIERFDLEDEALSVGLDDLAYDLSQRASSY